jgi:predicted DNA-binding transcriptional regulator YafY
VRTFAVERIERIEALERRFRVPDDFDFDAWSASSFGVVHEPATAVRIRFDRRWASYVEEHIWHASQKIERAADGSAELSMQVGNTSELRGWILSFGAGAEVLEPEALRRALLADLEAALARYRAPRSRRRR